MSSDTSDLAPTARQLEVLRAIDEHIKRYRWAPTFRELMADLAIESTNGVSEHLEALERKRLIERGVAQSRALAITDLGRRHLDARDAAEVTP